MSDFLLWVVPIALFLGAVAYALRATRREAAYLRLRSRMWAVLDHAREQSRREHGMARW